MSEFGTEAVPQDEDGHYTIRKTYDPWSNTNFSIDWLGKYPRYFANDNKDFTQRANVIDGSKKNIFNYANMKNTEVNCLFCDAKDRRHGVYESWGSCLRENNCSGALPGRMASLRLPLGSYMKTFKGDGNLDNIFKSNIDKVSDDLATDCTGNPVPENIGTGEVGKNDYPASGCSVNFSNLGSLSNRENEVQAGLHYPTYCQLGDFVASDICQDPLKGDCEDIVDTEADISSSPTRHCNFALDRLCDKQIGDNIKQTYNFDTNEYEYVKSDKNWITEDICSDFCGDASTKVSNMTLKCKNKKENFCFKKFFDNYCDLATTLPITLGGFLPTTPPIIDGVITKDGTTIVVKNGSDQNPNNIEGKSIDNGIYNIYTTTNQLETFYGFARLNSNDGISADDGDDITGLEIHILGGDLNKGKTYKVAGSEMQIINTHAIGFDEIDSTAASYEYSNLYSKYCQDFCRENPSTCESKVSSYCRMKIPELQDSDADVGNETCDDLGNNALYVNTVLQKLKEFPQLITNLLQPQERTQSLSLGKVCGCQLGQNFYKRNFCNLNSNISTNNNQFIFSEDTVQNELSHKPQCYFGDCLSSELRTPTQVADTQCNDCIQIQNLDVNSEDICSIFATQNNICGDNNNVFINNENNVNCTDASRQAAEEDNIFMIVAIVIGVAAFFGIVFIVWTYSSNKEKPKARLRPQSQPRAVQPSVQLDDPFTRNAMIKANLPRSDFTL